MTRKASLIIQADKIGIDPNRKAEFVGGEKPTDERRELRRFVDEETRRIYDQIQGEKRREQSSRPRTDIIVEERGDGNGKRTRRSKKKRFTN